jgi:AsmA family protein
MAHGQVTSKLSLDSNQKSALGKLNMQISGLNLRELFPTSATLKQPLGSLYGRVDITGRGTSIAELFGTAEGRLAMLVNGGYIGNLLVEVAGPDVAEALRILATRDVASEAALRCG